MIERRASQTPVRVDHVDYSHPHFVGAQGAGMAPLGALYAATGASKVTGCDQRHCGHDPEHVIGASCLVVSTAIPDDHVEVQTAHAYGVPVVHRGQALADLMAARRGAAVAGTHGKTSTSAMLITILSGAGLDPSYAIGGRLLPDRTSGHLGDGDVLIAEADESDGSFILLEPNAALITNVDDDHLDRYDDLVGVLNAFEEFACSVDPGGVLVVCTDDYGVQLLRRRLRTAAPDLRIVTYGSSPRADVHVSGIRQVGTSSEALLNVGGRRVPIALPVPGKHQVFNAAGAVAAAAELGVAPDTAARALAHYRGVDRRLTVQQTSVGITVIDSYARHPAEITADLEAARAISARRVLVVCEPSGAARTSAHRDNVGRALAAADHVVLLPVHTTLGPDLVDPATCIRLSNRIEAEVAERGVDVWFTDDPEQAVGILAARALTGDVIVTMGVGEVADLGPRILGALGRPVSA